MWKNPLTSFTRLLQIYHTAVSGISVIKSYKA